MPLLAHCFASADTCSIGPNFHVLSLGHPLSEGKADRLEEEVRERTPYQQTLERALELLWERLPDPLRSAWTLAASFSDERASNELADACSLGRRERAQLRDFHLLQGEVLGWTMHRLIRSFARHRSLPDTRNSARERLVRGCATRLATARGMGIYGQDRAHFDLALQYGEALPVAVEESFARLQLEVGVHRALNFGSASADELLRQAARFFGELAGRLDVTRDRLAYARAQLQRARALRALGAWGFTVDTLREAVDAVRESLAHLDRATEAEEWTEAQILLGNTLLPLADRVKEPQGYSGATEAFRQALAQLDPQRDLVRWARIQRSAAIALSATGTDAVSLEPQRAAVQLIRAIPAARLRELDPFEWADLQSALGQALSHLGTATADPVTLREAVAELDRVPEAIAPETHPTLWARSQFHLGNSYRELAELSTSMAAVSHLESAVAAFRASLSAIERERLPMPWAATMSCLGDALSALGHLRPESSAWEESLHCKELALQEYGSTRDAHLWPLVLSELGLTRCLIAARDHDPPARARGQKNAAPPFGPCPLQGCLCCA